MSDNMTTAHEQISVTDRFKTTEVQNWVKGMLAQNITRKALCYIIENKWNIFISELTTEERSHIETFIKCLQDDKIKTLKTNMRDLTCGHRLCEKILNRLLALRNFTEEPLVTYIAEIAEMTGKRKGESEMSEASEAEEDSGCKATITEQLDLLPRSSLSIVLDVAKLYVYTDSDLVMKSSLVDLDISVVVELMNRCKLFSFDGSQEVFSDVLVRRNTWIHSSKYQFSKDEIDTFINCLERLLENYASCSIYQCSDAIADLRHFTNIDVYTEYNEIEYMHMLKMVLEIEKTSLNHDISSCKITCTDQNTLDDLLKSTSDLLVKIDELISEAEPDEVTELKTENETLRHKLKLLLEEKEELKSEISFNEKRIEELASKNQKLEDNVQQLKSELEQYRHSCPGKPTATDIRKRSIQLSWDPSPEFADGDFYQIRYKEKDEIDWKLHADKPKSTMVKIDNLRPGTAYKFFIRTVYKTEGRCSPESECIATKHSLASRIIDGALKQKEGSPAIYELPMTLLMQNNTSMVRKYLIGSPDSSTFEDKIIMFGAAGTEKKMLIDNILNYILGVVWEDPFRFTVANPKQETQNNWITRYVVNPEETRLHRKLEIIYTPDFNGEGDEEKSQNILRFLHEDSYPRINAICLVASETHISISHGYIYDLVKSLFGEDIRKYLYTFITFSNDHFHPVVEYLKESGMLSGDTVFVNNACILERNDLAGIDTNTSWDMSYKSFEKFFKKIDWSHCDMYTEDKVEIAKYREPKEYVYSIRVDESKSRLQKMIDDSHSTINTLQHQMDLKMKYIWQNANKQKLDLQRETVKMLLQEIHRKCNRIFDIQ